MVVRLAVRDSSMGTMPLSAAGNGVLQVDPSRTHAAVSPWASKPYPNTSSVREAPVNEIWTRELDWGIAGDPAATAVLGSPATTTPDSSYTWRDSVANSLYGSDTNL